MTENEKDPMSNPAVGVTAYITGHGVFMASLRTVLRTARIIDKAWESSPYPFPYRATCEEWMVQSGITTPRPNAPGVMAYLYDHESEEQCLLILASLHPGNDKDNLHNAEDWERKVGLVARANRADQDAEEEMRARRYTDQDAVSEEEDLGDFRH